MKNETLAIEAEIN